MTDLLSPTSIADVIIAKPASHNDGRGNFSEIFRQSWFPSFKGAIQWNKSDKKAGSLVGLHYHINQSDYWFAFTGRANVVLHDLRLDSPTKDVTLQLEIGEENPIGIFIPPGVSHGFVAFTDLTLSYLVDGYYDPAEELGVAWDDPDIGAEWGIGNPTLSSRDRLNPLKKDLETEKIPKYRLLPSS